jgi:hypothetical protein
MGEGCRALPDETLMIAPPPRASISGMAARTARTAGDAEPAVGEDQRQRVRFRRPLVEEVDLPLSARYARATSPG